MINKNISKLLIAFALAFLLMPGVLYAAFEPSAITIDGASTGSEPQAIPDGNLDAVITPTTADTTDYTINKYVYVWNNSDDLLDDAELSVDSTSVPDGDTIVISTVSQDQFGTSDGDAWYLHVKTVYWSAAGGTQLSDDTIVGAYTFDNVAPVATISLDETVDGQTETTTSVSPVTILVTGDYGDINLVYVNTSANFNTADPYDFSDSSTTTLTYAVDGTGSKTLYAWFEDALGNTSADPDGLTFTVLAGKAMDPAGVMNLEVEATQVFAISGGGAETFDWSIVDATTGDPSTAATIVGASTGATVTITGATEENTVQVKAVSTVDAAEYTSGEITIVEKSQSFCLDVNGDGIVHGTTDGFIVVRYLLNFSDALLVSGNVITNSSIRTTAAEIKTYLDSAVADLSLDINDDGIVHGTTDGFLILRYLLNFSDALLISGNVITPGSNLTTATEIKAYLEAAKCGL